MEGLAGYILRRLLFLPVTLLVVSFATFYITRWGPGDPVQRLLRRSTAIRKRSSACAHKYGLDKPIIEQYGIWREERRRCTATSA